jgi:hypothetical protein
MKTAFKTALLALGLATALAGAAGTASADPRFQADHPRRVEVNDRLAHLHRRIAFERRHGEMSAREAHVLRTDLHRIRRHERVFAGRHHDRLILAKKYS